MRTASEETMSTNIAQEIGDEHVPIDRILWPTLEQMLSEDSAVKERGNMEIYSVVQVNLGGINYYRFQPTTSSRNSSRDVISEETAKLVERFAAQPGYNIREAQSIPHHILALDVFVKELLENSQDISKVTKIGSCFASYIVPPYKIRKPRVVELVISPRESSIFGNVNAQALQSDFNAYKPEHISLAFQSGRNYPS